MKKIFFLLIVAAVCSRSNAQEFAKQLTDAKTAYAAGKLDDSRFAMEQMLQELDIITGKEVLKLLPAKLENKAANTTADNVSGSSAYYGVVIHREYGTVDSTNINLDIISNSPMISSINAILSVPFINASGDNKVVRINGYKALLQKSTGANDQPEYELQLPLNSTLITLKAPGLSADQLVKLANSLPIDNISKLLQ